jgi:hypothetical protein
MVTSIDTHLPDIIEVGSDAEITCFANTPKGEHRMVRHYGRIELVFDMLSQPAEARAFTEWTKHTGLKVYKFAIQD